MSEGLGITINSNKDEADWVFSYGDIVNFYLNDEFYSNQISSPFTGVVADSLTENHRVRVGSPSESYLPTETRVVVREFMESYGLDPKVCLISWIDEGNKLTLTFNTVPTMFKKIDTDSFRAFLRLLTWYFPRHYKIACMEEKEYSKYFEPL